MDYWLLKQRIGMVGIVGVYWLTAAAAPAVIVGRLRRPDEMAGVIIGLIAAYCAYTGYRAWRRGWQARFVLRVAIPAVLFALGWAAVGVARWVS